MQAARDEHNDRAEDQRGTAGMANGGREKRGEGTRGRRRRRRAARARTELRSSAGLSGLELVRDAHVQNCPTLPLRQLHRRRLRNGGKGGGGLSEGGDNFLHCYNRVSAGVCGLMSDSPAHGRGNYVRRGHGKPVSATCSRAAPGCWGEGNGGRCAFEGGADTEESGRSPSLSVDPHADDAGLPRKGREEAGMSATSLG